MNFLEEFDRLRLSCLVLETSRLWRHEDSFVLGKDGLRFCLDHDELQNYHYQITKLQLNEEARKWLL